MSLEEGLNQLHLTAIPPRLEALSYGYARDRSIPESEVAQYYADFMGRLYLEASSGFETMFSPFRLQDVLQTAAYEAYLGFGRGRLAESVAEVKQASDEIASALGSTGVRRFRELFNALRARFVLAGLVTTSAEPLGGPSLLLVIPLASGGTSLLDPVTGFTFAGTYEDFWDQVLRGGGGTESQAAARYASLDAIFSAYGDLEQRASDAAPPIPPQSTAGAAPPLAPAQWAARDFDRGGDGIAYWDATPGDSGGAGRDEDVDVFPDVTAETGTRVLLEEGEWLEYSFAVAQPGGAFEIAARGSSASFAWLRLELIREAPVLYQHLVVPLDQHPLPVSGSAWQELRSLPFQLSPGRWRLRLRAQAGPVSLDWVALRSSQQ
jgi:hypothetical protein